MEGGESAALLARLATADNDELSEMLDVAGEAQNRDLGRAVFAAAHRREDPGDLLHRYFREVAPEAQGLYHEFLEAPSPEAVERQGEDIDSMIPEISAEQLSAPATANS